MIQRLDCSGSSDVNLKIYLASLGIPGSMRTLNSERGFEITE